MSAKELSWLDSPLQSFPRSYDVRREIVSHLWHYQCNNWPVFGNHTCLESYFKYFGKQCSLALHDNGRYLAVCSYREVFAIVKDIREGLPREKIFDETTRRLASVHSEETIQCSIDFVTRLCLMTRLGRIPNSHITDKPIFWEGGSLQDWLVEKVKPKAFISSSTIKLEKLFIARNLGRIANIEVYWTDNLADHLRLLDDDTKLAIFHNASFLRMVKHSGLYPSAYIKETIRTLALLFPQLDRDTRRWLKRLINQDKVDKLLLQCGNLNAANRQIETFHFWRNRLIVLKQVFDETQPNTWKQWWYDKRRGVQRYPMLVAATALVLTALFGLIQCIEGGMQTYKAYQSPP